MAYVFHRGEYVNENQATITKDNRGFRFGDGFFESIRVMNGKALFLDHHLARIHDSFKALQMEEPSNFTDELLASQIQGLITRNAIHQGGKLRITFFRKSLGNYLPRSNDSGYFIESDHMLENEFILNKSGKVVDIYTDFKKDINRLSIYKTLNSQLYVLGAMHAHQKGLDDVLIQNNKLSIIESTACNMFIVSNGVLYTPSLQDGCVAGTMRMNIINLAIENKIKVYECALNPQNLLSADELFLTNAIRGIEWVVAYRTKRYYNEMSRKMTRMLNDLVKSETLPPPAPEVEKE
ncbi:MAG: aminotransferase class IV [Nitrospirota bacterium]|nr:aminotransferase class IV [Nitrospirota bacterium]